MNRLDVGLRTLFPPRADILRLVWVTILPIHLWAFILFMINLPALFLSMSWSQIIGVFAYHMALAFMESLTLLVLLLVLSAILPAGILRKRISSRGPALVFALVIWAVSVKFHTRIGIRELAWLLYLLAALLFLTLRFPMVSRFMVRLADAMEDPAMSFLFLDVLALVIVMVRNVP